MKRIFSTLVCVLLVLFAIGKLETQPSSTAIAAASVQSLPVPFDEFVAPLGPTDDACTCENCNCSTPAAPAQSQAYCDPETGVCYDVNGEVCADGTCGVAATSSSGSAAACEDCGPVRRVVSRIRERQPVRSLLGRLRRR